jgi:hypothetical protein
LLSRDAQHLADDSISISPSDSFTADERINLSQFAEPIPIDYTNSVVYQVSTAWTLTVGPTILPGQDVPSPSTSTAFIKSRDT